jgi:Ca-activated chloride channel family protein
VVGLGTVDGRAAVGEGMAIYLQLDEPTLREVARMAGGEYYHSGTAEALRSVYQKLGSRVQIQTRETQLTALVALLSAILIVAGSGPVGAVVRARRVRAGPQIGCGPSSRLPMVSTGKQVA